MALLADYTNLTDTNLSAAQLNSRFQSVWNALGYTTLGQGTLDWTNLSLTAALRNTQMADTAVVCGTGTSGTGVQTITKKTAFDSGSMKHETGASNRETIANADASTLAARTFWKKWAPVAALTINTLLPGTVHEQGDTISIVVDNSGSAGTFTLTHTTDNTLNAFRLKGGANRTIATLVKGTVGTFVYGSPLGEANNMWWEI